MSSSKAVATAASIPPHAPEGGRLRRLLGPLYVTGIFWYRFHLWGVSILPSWGVAVFIALFTTFFFFTLRRIRSAIASNLAAVLGPCGWWRRQGRIYRTMWSFAWCLSERYERVGTSRRLETTAEGMEHWNRLLAEGRGFILTTAHIGHWELGADAAGCAGEERKVHLVREEEMDAEAQRFVREVLDRQGADHLVVHFAREDPSLGAQLLAGLRRGEIVALQGDRRRSHSRTVPGFLFGRPFELPAGPAALARAAEVPMLPVFVFREGRQRSRLVFRPPITVPQTGDRETDLSEAMAQVAKGVEAAIRERPFQWFCFRKLWPGASS